MSKVCPVFEDVRKVALLHHDFLSSTLLACKTNSSKDDCNTTLQQVIYKGLADFPYSYFRMDRDAVGVQISRLADIALIDFKTTSAVTTLDLPEGSHISSYIDLLKAVAPHRDVDSIVDLTSKLLDQKIPPREHGLILRRFEEWLQTIRQVRRVELFSRMINFQEEKRSSSHVQMVHFLIKSLTQEETALSHDLSACLGKLCNQLRISTDAAMFGACMDCINTILRTKQWLVNQYGIDTLLKALTTILSPRPGRFRADKHQSGFIYQRLCQTTTNILLLHRKRTGGRFHLLVPLLQNFLSCLFTPHSGSTSSLPPWIHGSASTLTTSHATFYTRILTTLSSPTSSSTALKWHNTAPNLVDEIKKAKLYAGQYVPYILMHYCSLQLSGSIGVEVRDALKSGIWSLMDVVDMEGMRGMNAGMGRDERVMWGSLYVEWNKYGRGKERR
jgi:nucleolar pre-ribosomal-associated protein 2